MNGVRRFFAATNVAVSSQTPSATDTASEANPLPPKPPPLQPITVTTGKQLYPTVPENSSPVLPVSSPTSPRTTTAGLFIRKDRPNSPRNKPINSQESKPLPHSPTSPPSAASRKPIRPPTPPAPSTSSATRTNDAPRCPPIPGLAHTYKQSVSVLDANRKLASPFVNTRDDLLMSLLSSEAVVDSRGFEILGSEEVEELKREQQLLSSRLVAVRKKVTLETKIRDAALNLQKVQTVKRLSKQTSEQIESGNRKVDAATKELSKLIERASDVDRKLLEHRAGVLSFSVRCLEAKLTPPSTHGDMTEDTTSTTGSGVMSQGLNSPTSSITSMSTRAKFDGAHLFAGHADSILPGAPRKAAISAHTTMLEQKLKATEEDAEDARARESELQKQFKLLQLEKSDVETTLNLELQTAEETILKLERELTVFKSAAKNIEDWRNKQKVMEEELDEQARVSNDLRHKVEELESVVVKSDSIKKTLFAKEEELKRLQDEVDLERAGWSRERKEAQRVRDEFNGLQVATDRLNDGRDALLALARLHDVPTSPSDTFKSIVASLGAHLSNLTSRLQQSEEEKMELDVMRRKYEEDVRNGFDIRERLGREIEEARKEREEVWRDNRALEARIKEQSEQIMEFENVRTATSSASAALSNKPSDDHAKLLASLRSLWSVLPSVEARASKIKSNTLAPPSPGGNPSLSDMDVRALKSLYDPKVGFNSPAPTGEFSVEEFVSRVHALLADDRALIARLIRFAQSHDLLRSNAERAQKLAQDSNKGLEMYQSQVNSLEDRNVTLSHKQLQLLDEINSLQRNIDQVQKEKRQLELQAAEQTETMRSLQTSNNTLSARALAFAEEAASAPNALKAKLESQISELQIKLKAAQDEIERMQSSESTQRVALLDELNSLQQENGKLRDQLRAKK